MVMSLKWAKLLAGVLVFVFAGFVSAKPQADVSGWTAIDMFVRYQIDMGKAKGISEDPYFVDRLTNLVLQRFDKELDAEIAPYAGNLTPEQREQLKYLLISDYISYLYQKSFYPKNAKTLVVKPIKVASVKAGSKVYDYYYAPMSSSIPYPIHWWVQVRVDLDGGKGRDSLGQCYDVDGHNGISKIVVRYASTKVTYEIHFYDEDHPDPAIDAVYDKIRCVAYPGRDSRYGCEDIESITVEQGTIKFAGTWSNICANGVCVEQTYAMQMWPQHETGERPYSISVAIYVSNVWDHLMDTVDSNPDMDKNWGYTSWT